GRGYAPSPHAQATDTPDRDRLLVWHPRLPRPARERTRWRTPGGLADACRRGPLELPRMGCLIGRLPTDDHAAPRAQLESKSSNPVPNGRLHDDLRSPPPRPLPASPLAAGPPSRPCPLPV